MALRDVRHSYIFVRAGLLFFLDWVEGDVNGATHPLIIIMSGLSCLIVCLVRVLFRGLCLLVLCSHVVT